MLPHYGPVEMERIRTLAYDAELGDTQKWLDTLAESGSGGNVYFTVFNIAVGSSFLSPTKFMPSFDKNPWFQ